MSHQCQHCGADPELPGPHHTWSCPRFARDTSFRRRVLVKAAFLTGYRLPVSRIRTIHIEPIAACNLKCGFCQVPGWERAKKTDPMDTALFTKILDQIPNLGRVKIQGMGEPMLNKKLPELIGIASQRNIKTTIVTNGTLLRPEMSRKLLEAKLTHLSVSFDGATKKTYEALRVNAKFDEVTENITQLCHLKKQMQARTHIRLVCLVSDEDVLAEIPELVELAAKMGVDEVMIKKRLKIWHQETGEGVYSFKASYLDGFPDYMNILERAHQIATKLNINFKLVHDADYSSSYPCRWPFDSLYVATEGKVVPCCVLGMPETWCMGDLTREPLKKIWNNKAYRALRRGISLNRIPKLCQNCYRSSS